MTGGPLDLDRIHALMMAALDGDSTPEERAALEAALGRHPELAAEYRRLQRVKEVTSTMAVRQPPEEVWDRYRVTAMHRVERSVAWLLLASGLAVLGAWGLWHWLDAVMSSDVPIVIKGAIVAVVIGGLLLLASIGRERWRLSRRDPYSKEVIR